MENKIKMIITDLDKSLLNNERTITKYTKDVFLECINNGIIIVFASARPLRYIKIFNEFITPNAIICHNGAIAYINNTKLYSCGINPNIAKYLLENIIEKYPNVKLSIETNDKIYSNFDPSLIWKDIIYEKMDLNNFPKTEIDKIIIGMENINEIKNMKYLIPEELYLEISEGEIGLIMNKGATKWNGIKKILEYYKMDVKNTIAFGDDLNDLEMIKNCGVGVAMENGLEEIKNNANYICGNNEEDGIAKWIKKNIK